MKIWDKSSFVRDLSVYVKLIQKYEVPVEKEELFSLESHLNGNGEYRVKVKDVVINITKQIAKTKPPGVTKIVIYFSNEYKCDFTKDSYSNDPLKEYYFYFEIKGYGVNSKEYKNCWRLDQHIPSNEAKYTHPYYHFHAGGDELKYLETGDLILLSAPRLPHPPMDLFLGLHFILSNYLSTKDYLSVKSLFSDYEYQEIIKRAQQRMWEAYFKCFDVENTHKDFTFGKVFPLFIR